MNSEEHKDVTKKSSPPVAADFVYQLYLILVGLAFGFGIESYLEYPGIDATLRALTLFVLLVIWLHGQAGFSDSHSYSAGGRLLRRLMEHYLEIGAVLSLVAASLLIQNEIAFWIIIAATYLLDLFLEVSFINRIQNSRRTSSDELVVAKNWVRLDAIGALVLIAVPLTARTYSWDSLLLSLIGLIVVVALTAVDYSKHKDFYFGK